MSIRAGLTDSAVRTIRRQRIDVLHEHYGESQWVFESVDRGEYRYVAVGSEGAWDMSQGWCPERYLFYVAETEREGFEILGGSFLEGVMIEAVYDLDTGERIELHISTPIVSRAEDQGMEENPLDESVES